MNILVFGANSHLAAMVIQHHLDKGDRVTGIVNRNTQRVNQKVLTLKPGDLDKIQEEMDLVYIIGAFVPFGKFNVPDQRFEEVNVQAVTALCAKFKSARVIFCSSVSVYGNNQGIREENTVLDPLDFYASSKVRGEAIVKEQNSWAILRFPSLYGPGVDDNNFINRMLTQARHEQRIVLYGNGHRKQNYLYITDASRYLLEAAHQKGNCVLLATYPQSFSNVYLATFAAEELNVPVVFTDEDPSPSFEYNNQKTRDILNFTPVVHPFEGINHIIHES